MRTTPALMQVQEDLDAWQPAFAPFYFDPLEAPMLENGLSVITVKKSELLSALKKNQEEHRALFLEAQEGYRKAVIKELDEMLAEARAGKGYRKIVNLIEPQDHTRDYLRIVRMLEMSIKDEIQISEQEFAWYVLDDWAWKSQFIATSTAYSSNLR
jgi:hypothetical protein